MPEAALALRAGPAALAPLGRPAAPVPPVIGADMKEVHYSYRHIYLEFSLKFLKHSSRPIAAQRKIGLSKLFSKIAQKSLRCKGFPKLYENSTIYGWHDTQLNLP